MYIKFFIILIYLCLSTNAFPPFCKTSPNPLGLCVEDDECTNLRNHTNDYLKSLICSPSNSRILKICCIINHNALNLRKKTSRKPKEMKYSPSIATRKECGQNDALQRIYFGDATRIDDFPWMALLRYRNKTSGKKSFDCAGSLIGHRYVLTAAHCVSKKKTDQLKLISVRLGEYDIGNPITEKDCMEIDANVSYCADLPIDVGIEQIISHAFYNTEQIKNTNDIALIRLDRDILYTRFIKPICLPTIADWTPMGEYLSVAGWGWTEKGPSEMKLQVNVPVVSINNCREVYNLMSIIIKESQICAGVVHFKDACKGDSGGPLMSLINNTTQWYIEGIVSFGSQYCGDSNWPSVYTKVSSYLDWINDNVY